MIYSHTNVYKLVLDHKFKNLSNSDTQIDEKAKTQKTTHAQNREIEELTEKLEERFNMVQLLPITISPENPPINSITFFSVRKFEFNRHYQKT